MLTLAQRELLVKTVVKTLATTGVSFADVSDILAAAKQTIREQGTITVPTKIRVRKPCGSYGSYVKSLYSAEKS